MFQLIILIILIAFIFEFMDSAAGMGFGTGLTPLLLILGYSPLQVVPTLLISQAITGFIKSYFSHEFENVNFSLRPLSDSAKLAFIIGGIGCIGIFFSIMLTYMALHLPKTFIQFYVAMLVLFMGVFSVFRNKMKQKQADEIEIKSGLLFGFSAIAGFNKGIGAGGYGPVITLGQIYSGVYEKSATAIVSLAEAMVCIVGIVTFFFITAFGVEIDLTLLPSIFTGGFIAAIITPYLVRITPNKIWRYVIPLYAVIIGIYLLYKIIFT